MDFENMVNFDFLDIFGADEPEFLQNLTSDINSASCEDNNRFQTVTENDISALKEKSRNKNTAKTTKTWINTFKSWAEEKHERSDIENIPPKELNIMLERFYTSLRKKDNTDYEPESLAVMQAAIDRYLKEKNYCTSIVRGTEFYSSNVTLKGKAAELRERGKGNRPNASKPLTNLEEEELWNSGKLGSSDSETLVQTVWFNITQHLGFRGRQEHKIADVEEFQFGIDENNMEFVTYNDVKPTKTRPGGLRSNRRPQRPRMYATGTERCPVEIFRKYLSHRPEGLQNKGPLYLSTISNPKSHIWYKNQKMGVNRIGEMMRRIVSNTNIAETKRLTNHSARKTSVKKLDDADVPREKIMAVTGHRNEKSLDDYVDSMNNKQSKHLSEIISGKPLSTLSTKVNSANQSKNDEEIHPSISKIPSSPWFSSYPSIRLSDIGSNATVTINLNAPKSNTENHSSTAFPPKPFKRIKRIVDDDDDE